MNRSIFALTGDTHADAFVRFDEHNEIMAWIVDDARHRGARCLMNSGDVYERASNALEREAVIDWVMRSANFMPTVIVSGNHDDHLDIDALGKLRTKYPVHAVTRPDSLIPIEGDAGPLLWVACLPWPRKAYLLAGSELTRADSDAAAVTALRNILRDYGTQFTRLTRFDVPRVFLGHCMMRGSKVGASQPPMVGHDFDLGIEDLGLVGADFYGLGHIHLEQDWRVLRGEDEVPSGHFRAEGWAPIVYPGAPRRKTFGEIEPKSYVLVTFEGRELVGWERIPTPCREMLHVRGSFAMIDGEGRTTLADNQRLPENARGAEIRLTYETNAYQREPARKAFEAIAERLRSEGAALVMLQEVVKVENRARAPEVATARTNAARLSAFWQAKGREPERRPQILEKLEQLEGDQTQQAHARPGGGLRYKRLSVQGIGTFDLRRDIHFDELDGSLTAVTGENGAGKSTLLELLHATIYGDCPTRGSLVDLATTRSAFVEVEVETGGFTYCIRQNIDGVARKREAVITRDGEPVVESTKISAVAAYVGDHFPDPEVLLVSTFIAQQSRGFLAEKPTARKSLLLKVHGVERLEALSSAARGKSVEGQNEIRTLEARIGDQSVAAEQVGTIGDYIEAERLVLAGADASLQAARDALEAGKTTQAQALERYKEVQAHNEKTGRVRGDLARAQDKAENLRVRIASVNRIISRAVEIRAATIRLGALDQAAANQERTRIELAAEKRINAQKREAASKTRSDAADSWRKASHALKDRSRVEAAVAALPDLEAIVQHHEANIEAADQELEALRARGLGDAETRITGLRRGLTDIKDGHELDPARIARITLERDDAEQKASVEVPKQIQQAKAALAALEADALEADSILKVARENAAKAPLIEAAVALLETSTASGEAASAHIKALDALDSAIDARLELNERERQATEADRRTVDVDAREAAALERSEAILAELRPQLDETTAEIERLRAEREALGPTPDLIAIPDIARLTAAVREAERAPARLNEQIQKATARLEAATAAAAAVAEMEAKVDALTVDVIDWIQLATDLGRDGLQAAISDAALPELVALTNTLLHSAFGPRFTVDVRSQAADAKGKRMLETLDVVVFDTLHKREALAETYSGGELTIIGEGLSLALTSLACRASGATRLTLVRDEAGAALDPENARAWINMLRRAVEMTGADRLLFVSHSEELAALADSKIKVVGPVYLPEDLEP